VAAVLHLRLVCGSGIDTLLSQKAAVDVAHASTDIAALPQLPQHR
jgi:hypothetical protein